MYEVIVAQRQKYRNLFMEKSFGGDKLAILDKFNFL